MLKDRKLSIIGLSSMDASLGLLLNKAYFFESLVHPKFDLTTFVTHVVDAESSARRPFCHGLTPSSFL
jgi:hypothetical protein